MSMFRKPVKAQVGLFSSLIVGVFGGYWIKFLRWKELDDLDGLLKWIFKKNRYSKIEET